MFKFIQVPANATATDDAVFRTAHLLARPVSGHLAFLHACLDVQRAIIPMIGGDMAGGGVVWSDVIDRLQNDVDVTRQQAHDAVISFCEREQIALSDSPVPGVVSASFRVDTGDRGPLAAHHGRTADLTVIGRGSDDEHPILDVMEAVLLDSGRPMMIATKHAPARIGDRIVIAWKDTPEAARAVSASLPFLAKAEAVTVVSVEEDGRDDATSGERLRQALRWHNPAIACRHVPPRDGDPVDLLMSVAEELGADLLVMGGYSHSRLREAVFGGFTRRILRGANLPVLMAH